VSVLQRDPGDRIQVLDEAGRVRDGATVPDLPEEALVGMYRQLRLVREFDRRAVGLQRQGRIGTYPPLAGQEAAQVASARALEDADWAFPSYREHGVAYAMGWPLERILLGWMGSTEGSVAPEGVNTFPAAIPVGTHLPHATGAAWAADLRDDDRAVVCYFGDGATSTGDFHEALNFAGVFDVPAVFFCNNNQYAISVSRERQTASATLAQKARAYGFEGVQVDGMDPLAVYAVTREAVRKAKDPDGDADDDIGRATRPTLVEAVQYRFGAHTTADDPTVYRDEEEVEDWKRKDPIPRMEAFLRDRGLLGDERVDAIEAAVSEEVTTAIERAEDSPRPEPAGMFEHVHADLPDRLADQRDSLAQLRRRHGDGTLREYP